MPSLQSASVVATNNEFTKVIQRSVSYREALAFLACAKVTLLIEKDW
ncbi:MAG: hypothetical protein OXH92_13985 [Bryobacterales bacterium]|nr:hypothetical protein [Bryobacterales bacterium]MDE0294947.1 hypothetical protein [Bryobacterales bacterium]MDE0435107.1 hypothetical protein [Bryobacterales bacterium]